MIDWLLPVGVLFYFLFIIYASNQAEAGLWSAQTARGLLYSLSLITFLIAPFSLQAVILSLQPGNEDLRAMLDMAQIAITGTAALCFAVFGYNLVQSGEVRERLARLLTGYQAESLVHQTAALLMMLLAVINIFNFVLGGGIEGVAESMQNSGSLFYSSLFETALFVTSAVLGVGYAIRRTMPATLSRLGLRMPTRDDVSWGVGMGLILCGCSFAFSLVWAQLADPETFAQQTEAANQLSSRIDDLPTAFFISGGSALGEEILMRGAIQPVFGLWITGAFFAVLHSQYLFTPTVVFIFILSAVFGVLRQRLSTTAAIIAHFVYNFTPFILLLLSGTPA